MKIISSFLIIAVLFISNGMFAQVGIKTKAPTSSFEVRADTLNISLPDGITPPRLTGDQLSKKIASYGVNQKGAIIYLTAAPSSVVNEVPGVTIASIPGFYYYDGSVWVAIHSEQNLASTWYNKSTGSPSVSVSDTIYHLNLVGIGTLTPDSMLTVNGGGNFTNDVSINSVNVGLGGGQNVKNTIVGNKALDVNTSGFSNVAVGNQSMLNNVSGYGNVAVGAESLNKNDSGYYNVAIGYKSLNLNAGNNNTAVGYGSAQKNTAGSANTALGFQSLFNNTTGRYNTALGNLALFVDTIGNNNTAIGYSAGGGNSGSANIFVGSNTGNKDQNTETPGDANIFIGSNAGSGMSPSGGNVIIGSLDSSNSALDPTVANAIYLGTGGTANSLADGLLRMKIDSAGATEFYGTLSAVSSIVATASSNAQVADGITAPILTGDELFAKNAAYTGAQEGSMIYLSAAPTSVATESLGITMASDRGYYYYDGTQWQTFGTQASDTASAWFSTSTNLASMSVNDSVYHLNAVGIGTDTPDSMLTVEGGARITNDILVNGITVGYGRANNAYTFSLAVGTEALINNISGSNNTAIGFKALSQNTSGSHNTALGSAALTLNTSGYRNTALGSDALSKNLTGYSNVAIGNNTMRKNTTGRYNLAIGNDALATNSNGESNLAIGEQALNKSTTANQNLAIGYYALNSSIIGNFNVAIGSQSLRKSLSDNNMAIGVNTMKNNVSGTYNVAVGNEAGAKRITGDQNTSLGYRALFADTSGVNNVALGYEAGAGNGGSNNIFVGARSGNSDFTPVDSISLATIGDGNIFVGSYAGTGMSPSGGNVIIGSLDSSNSDLDPTIANAIYLGTGGTADTLADGILRMKIDSAGDTKFYGSVTSISAFYSNSDRRLKTNIQDIVLPDNFLDLIKPVVYDKKSSMDATNYSFHEYGFIAQDIQKLFPSIVNKANDKDETLSISYSQLIPVLTKVLQDQDATIKKYQISIDKQQLEIDNLKKELDEIKAALIK